MVETDAAAEVIEPGAEGDNTRAAGLDVALAPYANLVVTDVEAPALTIGDPAQVTIGWTVENQGPGRGITDDWTDRIFVSADGIRGNAEDVEIARFARTGGLDAGGAYTRSERVFLPPGFTGRFTLYVTTDVGAAVFENGLEGDNTLALTGNFDVAPIPYADMVVTGVEAPATAQSGRDLALRWTVENRGIGQTNTSAWEDLVYIATNPAGTGRILLGRFNHLGFVAPGASYVREALATLPVDWTGPTYVFVETPGTNRANGGTVGAPFELVFTDAGNTGRSDVVDVTLSPPPNLIVTAVTLPPEVAEGTAIDVEWTVQNAGTGPAAGTWTDRLVLRRADAPGRDIAIGSYSYTGPLQAGTSYSRREQIILPAQITGRYDLIVITDFANTVYEHTSEGDNESAGDAEIVVTAQPRPDLQVFDIFAPDRLTAGATGAVRWQVINQGPVATTTPNWTDSVYLSLDDKVTFDDIRVGSRSNGSALGFGDIYTSDDLTFRVPDRFRGTVYLIVQTDGGNAVDEWPNEANNTRLHEIYIDPIPFADLVVHDVVTPLQAFEGTSVSLTYSVTNWGAGATNLGAWTEQVWLTLDKNRPHPGQGDILLKSLTYDDGILAVGAGYDRTVTVDLPETVRSGTYYLTAWVDPYATLLEDPLATNVNPDDPTELNSSNYKAGGSGLVGLSIIGVPAPLVNPEIAVAIDAVTPVAVAGVEGQNAFSITYTITNTGSGPANSVTTFIDLADTPSSFGGTERWTLFGGAEDGVLDVGQSRTVTRNFVLAPGMDGTYVSVASYTAGDTIALDNRAVATTSVTSPASDLRVVSVIPPAGALSGEEVTIRYAVRNDSTQAVWSGTAFWTDEVWISKDPTFIRSRATLLSTQTVSNAVPLAAGATYERSVTATLPPGIDGDYYVSVFTNTGEATEPAARAWPRTGGSADGATGFHRRVVFEDPAGDMLRAEMPVAYREPDLQVTGLVVPDSLQAGGTVEITFTVTNVGTRATRESAWVDRVYLSLDPSLDSGDFLLRREEGTREVLAQHVRQGALAAGASYTATVRVTLPFELEGDFHVLAVADSGFADSGYARSTLSPRLPGLGGAADGTVREFQGEGNNTTSQAVTVAAYAPPNLRVTALDVPQPATRGQAFTVRYTVTNSGGPTPFQQAAWDDLVYISRDPFLDLKADRFVGTIRHTGGLAAGASYDVERSYVVPTDLATEAYYVFVVTDPARYGPQGEVYEGVETDNTARSADPLIIDLPPPTDLQVSDIRIPAGARAGEPITISWTITNGSDDVVAAGTWSDSVFLSTDGSWDISDRPIGRVQTTRSLAPGESVEVSLTTTMPPATPGGYRVIVRTDIFNQIHEGAFEANNTTASADVLTTSVDELLIGTPTTIHLDPGREKLFRITTPPGETMRITVRSSDPTATNEIFVRHDALPGPNAFDATYEGPLSSNLVAFVPSTEPGTYYISLRNYAGDVAGTDLTILAELLPLVITEVATDRGGDSRFVTTRIKGAQFDAGATVKLIRPGIAEFAPVAWQVVDSTEIIATFDLTGAALGLYDLAVTNPSGAQATAPYRFLVERAIEGDVTIGVGGARIVLPGDTETYSVGLQNLANLDAPYTFFQVGVPELHLNPWVYGLPFLDFFTNVRGTPDGAAAGPNADVFWAGLESIVNTNGQLTASGFLYDLAADGFAGFSFNLSTYPGLRELHDEAFGAFKARMATLLPDLDGILEEGGEAAIGDWFDALVDKAEEINPALGAALAAFPFEDLYNQNVARPGDCEIPFIPFRFHIFAAATSMNRDEFVAFQTAEALRLRDAILASDDAPGALLALAGDPQVWVDLFLAGLEQAGILRDEGEVPPIRTQQEILSLMATLASGILFGPAGADIRSDGDVLGFFEQLRTLYGHDETKMAEIEFYDPRESDCYTGEIPIAELPKFEDYDLGLTNETHFTAVRIYVPWVPFENRGAALPSDFAILGAAPVDGAGFETLDFSSYFADPANTGRLASISGPETLETAGWLPATERLPYTVKFENDAGASATANQIEIVTRLDSDLDARSFELGDIKIGDIEIDVPEGRWFYQDEIDFSVSHGFKLRVSAGIDLYQDPASARWVLQAVDPLTGEVLADATRGLLPPNTEGGRGAGFVTFTVRPVDDVETGAQITASARVVFDTAAPEQTQDIVHMVDGAAPVTQLTVARIAGDDYQLNWTAADDTGGSGVRHVTIYIASDGGDFRILERRVAEASGQRVFEGEAGHSYEFLVLATDIAGNVEVPTEGQAVTGDGQAVNLGAPATVEGSTPPNFGQAPAPTVTPSTNDLFTRAEAGIPSADPLTRPSEFTSVLSPFIAEAFATGIPGSNAGIAPMAILERSDGKIIVSGGANRGSLWLFDRLGGAATRQTLLAQLDDPVFGLTEDAAGNVWATTGGGALLKLDPATGQVVARHGIGVTLGLAIDPASGLIYVGTNAGISTFDPATGVFEQWSRDENLRVGSLAFDRTGTLWAVTWPDRTQVVSFTDRQRAEIRLTFDSQIDSIAFGQAGTALQDLLFVSANTGAVSDTGEAAEGSALTMVDLDTLRRVDLATGGTRGDTVIATSDGRILISQSGQVDVVAPAYAPSVVATNPPPDATVPLPLSVLTVRFDQDMFAGDPTSTASVLNAANYVLTGAAGGAVTPTAVLYDAASRTALLKVANLTSDAYTLTVASTVTSVYGLRMGAAHVTAFTAIDDLSAFLDITFGGTRYDRATGTVSFDVTVTNRGDSDIVLPALLTLDPQRGYAGLPQDAAGRTPEGLWLIDLSASLPADGRLPPGGTTRGQTIAIATPDRQRVQFTTGVSGGAAPNAAPRFAGEPPTTAKVGEAFTFAPDATDPDGQAVIYHLLSGPAGMTIDAATGVVTWTPTADTADQVTVAIQAFDARGAAGTFSFALAVEGGNAAPVILSLPDEVISREGGRIEVEVIAVDPDQDTLAVWIDGLPGGASFNPVTRVLTWTPGYDQAGTYPVTVRVSDGQRTVSAEVTLRVADAARPVILRVPGAQSVLEGDRIRFDLRAEAEPGTPITFGIFNESLPFGATLNALTGEFDWTPQHTQEGIYEVMFAASDGVGVAMNTVRIEVVANNGAPVFDPFDGLRTYEGQVFELRLFATDPDNPFYEPPVRLANGTLFDAGIRTVDVEIVDGLPPGATFDPDTWELKWTPGAEQAGTYRMTVRATDISAKPGGPKSVETEVVIEVLPLNLGPVLEPVENVTVPRGAVREIIVRATDPDGDPIRLAAESESPGMPLPGFVTFTDNGDGTGTLRLSPGVGDRGDYPLRVYAHDDGGDEGEVRGMGYVFNVKVESLNEPPVFAYQGDVVALAGQPLTVTLDVGDMDQDDLATTLAGLPAGAVLTADPLVYGRLRLTWTPTAAQAGIYTATVQATDTGDDGATDPATGTIAFGVTVRTTNDAPVLAPVGTLAATERVAFSHVFGATDSDGDGLTFSAADLPQGARFDRATGRLDWVPNAAQSGRYTVTVTVSDGQAASTEAVTIEVSEVNRAPVFVPMLTQLGRERAEISFTVVANDPDGDPVVMSLLSALPEGAGFSAASGVFRWIPGFTQAGDHVLRFAAQDANGASSVLEVTVSIADVNRVPVMEVSDRAFLVGVERTFLLSGSDPDGTALTYTAEDLPDGALLDAATGRVTWTPGPGQAGDYYVTFIASDGQAATRQTIVMRATLEPDPPTVRIELTPSFPALPGQDVLVQVVAASLADIASVLLYNGTTLIPLDAQGRALVRAPSPGKIDLRAVAVDADGLQGETALQIKVRDPEDRTAPDVGLNPALALVPLSGAVALEGFVIDQNIDTWRLELLDTATGAVLSVLAASGAQAQGVLATLDTRGLLNGFYRLRLTASDIGGRQSVTDLAIEVNGADKTAGHTDSRTDLSVTLGGIAFDLTRRYDSTAADDRDFGAWTAGFDLNLAISTGTTGREGLGVYAAMAEGTRAYLTAPDGSRQGFTFAPVARQVGALTFYVPAWVADNAGWTLASGDTLLRKSGGRFYTAADAAAYNVQDPFVAGTQPFVLTGPDGVSYVLSTAGQVQEIRQGAARLFVGASGITSATGEALSFLRDTAGRITRATTTAGEAVVYSYDPDGNLTTVRKLSDGSGARYGYDAAGRLVIAAEIGGAGEAVEYPAGGAVVVRPVTADLGGLSQFTGAAVAVPGAAAIYTLSVRESEIAGAAGDRLILRLELDDAAATATLTGADLLSVARTGGRTVVLYSVTVAGLKRLDVGGAGILDIRLGGDLNADGAVDATDSAALRDGLAGADITGDGAVDVQDRQVLNVNFGIRQNVAPVALATLPDVFTHADLPVLVDLDDIAADPDSDGVVFRVVRTQNVSASFTGDGQSLRLRPDAGFAGEGSITVVADDGFNTSAEITLDVTVSDAALLSIDFLMREYRFETAGEVGQVVVVGQFADQADVILPFDYVSVGTLNPTVAGLSMQGVLLAQSDGDTALVVTRGDLAAGTVVTVGAPEEGRGLITYLYGIDAYPDAVTVLAEGGTRQIVTSVGLEQDIFVQGEDEGVRYIVADEGVVTVDDEGLIRAVAEGDTTVTVIYRSGEETIRVRVDQPVIGDTAAIGTGGGALQTLDGASVAIGAGQLTGAATVTLETLAQGDLTLDVPPDFDFAGAVAFDVQGADLTGPVQLAVPVTGGLVPGDEVFFFVDMDHTHGTNGEFGRVWTLVDSGTVGADGMARTASPPFPGLTQRGNILVANANKPLNYMNVAIPALAALSTMILPAMAIAAVGGGLLGVLAATATILTGVSMVVTDRVQDLRAWQEYKGRYTSTTELITPTGIGDRINVSSNLPDAPPVFPDGETPVITAAETPTDENGRTTLILTVQDAVTVDPDGEPSLLFGGLLSDTRVRFEMGAQTRYVTGDRFRDVALLGDNTYQFTIDLPTDVLVTRAEIFFDRPRPMLAAGQGTIGGWNESTQPVPTSGFQIFNEQGYGIVGAQTFEGLTSVQILDTQGVGVEDATVDPNPLVDRALLDGFDTMVGVANDVLMAGDLSAAYAATREGVAVIDMLTLRQFDVDGTAPGVNLIRIPGGNVQKLAMSADGSYLYAAAHGKVYVIDLRVGSASFMKVLAPIGLPISAEVMTAQAGRITSMAVNADGTKLFVAVPYNGMFGANGWIRGGGTPGKIFVINVNPSDAPANGLPGGPNKFFQHIGTIDAYQEPYDIKASTDPKRLAFVSRGDSFRGFHTITITNSSPTAFAAKVETFGNDLKRTDNTPLQQLQLNLGEIGVKYDLITIPTFLGPFTIGFYRKVSSQKYDLDIRNAASLVIAPDLSFAFVADYHISRYLYQPSEYAYEVELRHDEGSKIGLIRNPFNMTTGEWEQRRIETPHVKAQLTSATSPIPMQALEDLALSPDGTQLFALFRAAGNVATYDVAKWIEIAQQRTNDPTDPNLNRKLPIDLLNGVFNDFGQPAINEDIVGVPFDVARYARGLSVQNDTGLELVRPVGVRQVHGATPEDILFEVRLDPAKVGQERFSMNLFMSSLPAGQGLFPSDPPHRRAGLFGGSAPTLTDNHPYRILDSKRTIGEGTGFAFESGNFYVLGANGKIELERALTEMDVPLGTDLLSTVLVRMSPVLAKLLTAGQEYYWGVEVAGSSRTYRRSTLFETAIPPVTTPFATVQLLTHGFQLNPLPDYGNEPLNEETLAAWLANAVVTNAASGGGIILVYNRQTGLWHEYDPSRVRGDRMIRNSAYNGANLPQGKAITLVADWYRESDISDTGYAEAASDAIFASLVHLDRQAGGKIFDSPMHFIGHSRGAAVNSEIIQRIGLVLPEVSPTIHMTTLDTHDFNQLSLNLDIIGVVENYLKYAKLAAAALTFVNPIWIEAFNVLTKIEDVLKKIVKYASFMGIQIKPMAFADFKDPDVQVWSNVAFSDNYYQKAADEKLDTLLETTFSGFTFSATPNGTALPNAERTPIANAGRADIDLAFTEGMVPGFLEDDGIGGPHSRITSWYMGTTNLNSLYANGETVWRSQGDAGTTAGTQPGMGFLSDLGALFGEELGTKPWYGISATAFKDGKLKPFFQDFFNRIDNKSLDKTGEYVINEAIGNGFYFSPTGGGAPYRPNSGVRTSLLFDNTEVANTPGTVPTVGEAKPVVPTVFNGDFESGTRHSALEYLKWVVDYRRALATPGAKPPKFPVGLGRFPMHYDLPGWNMHGGIDHGTGENVDEGVSFSFNVLQSLAPSLFEGPIDITGFFVVNTNVVKELVDLLKYVIDPMITKLLEKAAAALENKSKIANYKANVQDAKDNEETDYITKNNLSLVRDEEASTAAGKDVFNVHDSGGNFLMTQGSLQGAIGAGLDFLVKFDPYNLLVNLLINEWTAMYNAGQTLIPPPPNVLDILQAPANTTSEKAAKKQSIETLSAYIRTTFVDFIGRMFNITDLVKGTNYGLVFGAGQALKALVGAFLPDIEVDGLGGKNLKDLVGEAIDKYIGQADKITHNRVYIPRDMEVLEFSAATPFNITDDLKLEVTFTGIDGGPTYTVVKTVEKGFFTRHTYRFEIPPQLRGQVANFTIKHLGAQKSFREEPEFAQLFGDPNNSAVKDVALSAFGLVAEGIESLTLFMILDDIKFSGGSAQTAASQGTGAATIGLTEARAMGETALGIWADTGLLPGLRDRLDDLLIEVGDLEDGILARARDNVITIDAGAAGHGWFVDATPEDQTEYAATAAPHLYRATTGDAAGRYDLLTVLMHEIGNAYGLTDVASAGEPEILMTSILDVGTRRLPSARDRGLAPEQAATSGTPTGPQAPAAPAAEDAPVLLAAAVPPLVGDPTPFGNGRFVLGLDDPQARWIGTGDATVAAGVATLRETGGVMAGLSQTFALPPEVTGFTFRITGLTLGSGGGTAPDAFEAALFDARTQTPILGALSGLGGSDAFLNVQADGTRYLSQGVTVLESNGELVVSVDLSGLATRPDAVTLYFDLIGLGAADATAVIDDVVLQGLSGNTAPAAIDQTLTLDEDATAEVDLLAGATDGEGDALFVLFDAPPSAGTLTLVADGRYLFTPPANFSGTVTVPFTVYDGEFESDPATLTITVAALNDAPAVAPVDPQRVSQGTPFALTVAATDVEGEDIAYSLTDAPSGAAIDAATGAVTWPTAGQEGVFDFTVRATDAGGAFTEITFTLTVIAGPVFRPLADVVLRPGDLLAVTPVVDAPEAAPGELVFALAGAPAWVVFDPATGALSGDPAGAFGTADVTLTVTDAEDRTDSITFRLRALAAPVLADLPAEVVVPPGGSVDLATGATDADGAAGTLVFTLTGDTTGLAIDAGTGRVTGTPPVGTRTVTVTVTDADGLLDTATVSIRALAAPVLAALPAVTIATGTPLALTATATDADTDAGDLVFSLVGTPSGVAIDPATGALTGTPPAGTQTVTVRVTDGDGLTDEETFTLRVLAAPVLADLADAVLTQGAAFAATATATDADTDPGDLVFSLVGTPVGLSIDPETGALTGTPPVGAQTVTVRVTDGDGLTDEDSFALRVRALPVLGALTDLTLAEGTALVAQATATDGDTPAEDLTYSLVGAPAWASIDPETGAIGGDTAGLGGGTYTLTVMVTDADGLSDTEAFDLTVTDPAAPPEGDGGGDGGTSIGGALPIALLFGLFAARYAEPAPAPGEGGGDGQNELPPICTDVALLRVLPVDDLSLGEAFELPVMLESSGGIRRIVMEASFQTGKLTFDGSILAQGLPPGTRIAVVASTEGDRTVLRITITAPTALPQGALDLFWLRFRAGELAGEDLSDADLRLVTISINGDDTCAGPAIGEDLAALSPPAVALTALATADPVIDLHLGAYDAQAAVPLLLEAGGGRVAVRATGLGEANDIRLSLAYDADAFVPVIEGGDGRARLTLDPDRPGTAELHVTGTGDLAAGLVVLATLSLMRPNRALPRPVGRMTVAGVRVDGLDLWLTGDDDWTGDDPAAHTRMAGSFSIPMTPYPAE